MLVALPAELHGRRGERPGGRGQGPVADRGDLPSREGHPQRKPQGAGEVAHRRERSAPAVDAFFAWCKAQRQRLDLLPSSPFAKALAYAAQREPGLRVFLDDPAVSVDTNHLERGLRPIPTGRRNWLFAWTELGAQRVGVIQSLLATCRLQDVDAYAYLVDVLQRVSQHPGKVRRRTDAEGMEDHVRGPAPAVRPRPHQGSATSITGGCPERPGMSAYTSGRSAA